MKIRLSLISSAVLFGLVSQGTAALTVTSVGASGLATELRSLSRTDWAEVVSSGELDTTAGMFIKNNSVDNRPFTIGAGQSILVESIYKSASYQNEFGIVAAGALETPAWLTNLNLSESKKISSDTGDTRDLGFWTNKLATDPAQNAGVVTTSMDDNVWTFIPENRGSSYMVWLLEDYRVGIPNRDDDFNDFIVLGTISAVPEPSTIISLIAVGFLGFVTWRNRRKVKA